MNIKSMLVRTVVQVLAAKTDIIKEQDATTKFFNSLFGVESEEERLTRELEVTVDKTIAAAKRMTTNRKFKEIVKTSM
jgi:hypothetical protein